jgi:phage shock protein PspC (stress-responsive transcriptional regulator)
MCGGACGSIVAVMTDTTIPAARPLYRDPAEGRIAGVCAGLARYTDTDPVIWRIVAVVLAFFGGTGAVLYLVGWALLPKRQPDGTIPPSWLERHGRPLSPTTVLVIGVVALAVLGGFGDSRGVGAAAVIGLIGYLVYRDRHEHPRPLAAPMAGDVPPPQYAPPPPYVRVARARSPLGLVTLSVAAIVSGALSWAALAGEPGFTAGRIAAVALAVVGVGLVVGTWYGRARWLIVVGLALSLLVGAAAVSEAAGVTLHGGVGHRTWIVADDSADRSFSLGLGQATLDLRGLSSSGQHVVVRGRVSAGKLLILVPAGVPVRVHARARFGEIDAFGTSLAGGHDHVEATRSFGPLGDPRIDVDASVGSGQIEVAHA